MLAPHTCDTTWLTPAITLRSNRPVEQDPLAEIAPGHWIRLKMDRVRLGLSSRLVRMIDVRHRRENRPTPVANSNELKLTRNDDQKTDGRDG